jgi:PAS domain S-box-containing protein
VITGQAAEIKMLFNNSGLNSRIILYNDMMPGKNTDLEKPSLENSQFAYIVESISAGVIALDAKGKIVSFNRFAEQLTGFKAIEVLGKSFERVFKPDCFKNLELNFNDISRIEKTTEIRTQFAPNGRNVLYLNIAISPLISAAHGKIGAVLCLTDITRIQNLEKQANRTGRLAAMGEMAVRIAHEIRNPLGSIELFSTMLKNDLNEYEDLKTLAEHISSGVKSINNIVSNLLLFIRPDQHLDLQVLDVHEALKDSLFFARHLFDARDGVEVTTDLTDETLFISADLELLKQVFLNLILNAIQAMGVGDRLNISTRKIVDQESFGWAEVHVVDSGCGIATADLPKIFDPFYTTRKKGTGLGLTIVHNIIKMHGGSIDISSRPKEGTRCIVTLPLWIGNRNDV